MPFFIVTDMATALEHYRGVLGFHVDYLTPSEQPFFAIVRRDNVQIMLKQIGPDVLPQPNHTRHEWARWDAYVNVDDPDALAREFELGGALFKEQLSDTDDGLRGFGVLDADGYVIFFGRPRP
jgi:catechol 2,3-dioxygenase-like lactoylglutathione lyase family enzyme